MSRVDRISRVLLRKARKRPTNISTSISILCILVLGLSLYN